MNGLAIIEHHGQLYVDSRQVAEMVGKQHKHLLRDIGKYVAALQNSTAPKIGPSEFFKSGTYKDSTGRELPRYDCTKMGCEIIAHKLTGEKGILFTALYVKQFNEMERALLERQSAQWQSARIEGKKTRRMETDAIKSLVAYAKTNGSRNADRYYIHFSRLADEAVGITDREAATTDQLLDLRTI